MTTQQILNQQEWHRGNTGAGARISRFKSGPIHFKYSSALIRDYYPLLGPAFLRRIMMAEIAIVSEAVTASEESVPVARRWTIRR